jgi:16S rRNA C967 or C1407 C5-methylase (RsmB/RsmF family)
MIEKLNGGIGKLFAIEIDQMRCNHLKENIHKLIPQDNMHQVEIIRKDSRNIEFGGILFDRILCDVPCSGEGTFSTSNPGVYAHWSPQIVEK